MEKTVKEITGQSSKIEKATFSIEPFSPVLIGSGETYTPGVDFYCEGGNTYLFDHQKIFNEFLDDTDNLEKALFRANLGKYLGDHGKNPKAYVRQSLRGDVKGKDLSVPVTDGFGNPIIPGSSLKGSIRTALFAYLFQNANISAEEYGRIIASKYKVGDKALDQRLLTTFRRGKHDSAPNYDWGRLLRISDAAFKKGNLEVFNTIIANETNSRFQWKLGRKRNTPNLSEATQTSLLALSFDEDITQPVEFSISIDHNVKENIDWNKPFSFRTIAQACNSLSKKLIKEELRYMNEAAKNLSKLKDIIKDYKNLSDEVDDIIKDVEAGSICWLQRVGWGSGWLSMTGAHAYDEDEKGNHYMDVLRRKDEELGKKNRRYRSPFKRTGDFQFPKTRKIVQDKSGSPATSMGWIYVEKK